MKADLNIQYDLPDGIIIENMEQHHLDEVMEIETACFDSPWSRRGFEVEILGSEHSISLVVIRDSMVIGYGVVWFVADELYIANIAVHSDYRRGGIASLLIKIFLGMGIENGCKLATLEVRQSNQAATNLYNRFGFLAVAIRKGYYRETGEDALVMIKDLQETGYRVPDSAANMK